MADIDQTFTHDIFISYSHANHTKVQKLIRHLKADHFRVWVDEEQIGGGDPLRQVLTEGIKNSAHVMVCLSPQYIASNWTAFESAVAQQMDPDNSRRRVIPIRIEPCEIPTEYAHLYSPDLTSSHNWEREYKKTIKNIRSSESTVERRPVSEDLTLTADSLDLWGLIDRFLQQHPLISNLVSAALLTLGALLLRMVFPKLTSDYLSLISAVILLMILIASVTLRRKPKLVIGIAVVGMVILSSIAVVGYFSGWGFPERGATYLIIDASSKMQGLFQEIGPRINVTAKAIPDDSEVGLMIFGGAVTGSNGCDDIAQLVAPAPKATNVPQIERTVQDLTKLRPQGPGTLQRAILQAINKLTNRSGVQKIIVITSGVDNSCADLDRAVLEVAAGVKEVKFELIVLTVGTQSEQDQDTLNKFAHKYQPIEYVEEVPQTVATVVAAPIQSYYDPYYR